MWYKFRIEKKKTKLWDKKVTFYVVLLFLYCGGNHANFLSEKQQVLQMKAKAFKYIFFPFYKNHAP